MSDRFVLHAAKEQIENFFDVQTNRDDYFNPDFNITPGTSVPIIVRTENGREIKYAQWGRIPDDAKEEKAGEQYYELSVEQLRDKYSVLWSKRCIIPANGFYKWKTSKKRSTPFYIRLLSDEMMAIGGIYSIWQAESGREVYSFSMLTTNANALVQPVDERMPVILRKDSIDLWLDQNEIDPASLTGLLKPFLLTDMAVNRVSEDVNDPDINDQSLIQPIPK